MAKAKTVVRRISLETARDLLRDLYTNSLEKVGNKHRIRNFRTIPLLIRRAYVREGRKVPRFLEKLHKDVRPAFTVKVNRKGTIVIPKEAIEDTAGFRRGRVYSLRTHGGKIILTQSGSKPKS